MNMDVLKIWGINERLNAGSFSAEQVVYLKFHRQNRFKPYSNYLNQKQENDLCKEKEFYSALS